MSDQSKELRGKAAHHLKKSRRAVSQPERDTAVRRAASYKALAQNAEWLDGETERSAIKRKP